MAEDTFTLLVRVLRDRDVPYDREGLKSACSDPNNQTAIQEWIHEFLSPETLLTKDEATLYATLSKSGEYDVLAAQDLSLVQGLNDYEIQNAIEELKRSTAAIEKQSEALKLQQNAMNTLVKNNKRISQARAQTDKSQLRKWDVEKGQLNATIEELSQSLLYQIADIEQQSKATEAGVKQTVDSILKSDDKLLLSLQKLASDLDPGRPEDDTIIVRIRELCAGLIKHTVEGIRTRLDRIYLEALSHAPADHTADEQEINDLQEELESLYSEILPVAQMSAEQQYLEPALQTLKANNGQGQERSVKAVQYIYDCLIFLINRIETFLERAGESQCHRMATDFVVESAKKELVPSEPTTKSKPSSPAKSNTQARRRSSGTNAVLRRAAHRRSSGNMEEDMDPEQQLARTLGLSLPAEGVPDAERVEAIEKMLFERISRLEGHASSLQSTSESSIASHLLDAHMTLGILHDSLLAESLYGKVHLVDPSIEKSVANFEKDIQNVQQSLEAVDLHSLQSKNVHRDQFVQRWAR